MILERKKHEFEFLAPNQLVYNLLINLYIILEIKDLRKIQLCELKDFSSNNLASVCFVETVESEKAHVWRLYYFHDRIA